MTSEAPIKSSIVVESKATALAGPCRDLLLILEERGFTQDDIFAVHLALEEAFLNAVKHGNKMDQTKKVTIDYVVDRDKLEIRMTDEGAGFNPASIPDPRVGDNLYRPEGRGLLLMNSYMHEVEYTPSGNGLRMVRYRGRPIADRDNPAAS